MEALYNTCVPGKGSFGYFYVQHTWKHTYLLMDTDERSALPVVVTVGTESARLEGGKQLGGPIKPTPSIHINEETRPTLLWSCSALWLVYARTTPRPGKIYYPISLFNILQTHIQRRYCRPYPPIGTYPYNTYIHISPKHIPSILYIPVSCRYILIISNKVLKLGFYSS